jgi:ABC-type branched-subunit amino acid transport system substrate-binding protein
MYMRLRHCLITYLLAGISAVFLFCAIWGCAPRPVQTPSEEPPVTVAPELDPAARTAIRLKKLESDAAAFMESGDLKDAFYTYNQALTLNLDALQTQQIIEKVDQLLARSDPALIQTFLESPGLAVPEPLLHYWLGVNLAQDTEYTKALSVLTQFTDRWPDHPRVTDAQSLIAMIRQTLFKKDTIGCLLPLSGKYAPYGEKALKGIQLAIQEMTRVHGSKFSVVIKDTQGDPDIAAACVDELDQVHVAGIVGPLLSVDAAGARAQDLEIPLIALTQKEDFALSGDYLFSNFITPRMQVQTLAAYVFRTLGLEKVAILYPDEPYGRRHMELFSEAVSEYGARLEQMQAYDGNRTDFTDTIRKFTKQTDHPLEPSDSEASDLVTFDFEALFIPDAASRVNMILPQLAFNDIRDIVLLGTNLWHHQSLLDQTRGYNQNAIITEGYFEHSRKPATVRFNHAFSTLYGDSPGYLEAIFYDTVQIMLSSAMDPAVDSRKRLKDALLEERIFEGATGRTLFDENGAARKELFLITIKNNRFVELAR